MRLHGLSRRKQHASDVDAPSAAEVAEVQAANHLVGDEERVGVIRMRTASSKVERQVP